MKKRLLWWFGMLVYLAILLRITVFRPGIRLDDLFSGTLNLMPLTQYLFFARYGSWKAFIYYFAGNLIVFMPLGYLLEKKGISWQRTILVGFLCSLLIETGQFVLGSGVAETDDILLNTIGAVLGFTAARFFSNDTDK